MSNVFMRGPIALDTRRNRSVLERLVLAKGSALLQFPINLPLIASDL
jgi:hypothetical protein